MTSSFDTAEQQIVAKKQQADFDIQELSIEILVHKFKKHQIYVPEERKALTWSLEKQTQWIESIIWGIPMPALFVVDVAKQSDKGGKLEMIDGVQRLQTLRLFLDNQLILNGLHLLTELNGKSYTDLATTRRRRFLDTAMKVIVYSQKTTPEIRAEIFHRINMGRNV
jgi:hypothetical protein